MNGPSRRLEISVDPRNPGQFFACCGLLELAHRLWPEAEAWFAGSGDRFALHTKNEVRAAFLTLIDTVRHLNLSGLSDEERLELKSLDGRRAEATRQGRELSESDEQRRKQLGTRARAGALRVRNQNVWEVRLDWWQWGETPKTWAGSQKVGRIARAAQRSLTNSLTPDELFSHGCVMRAEDGKKKVEPFYFDSRRFTSALDAGFSLNELEIETVAHPAVELLALIGLQRFRPVTAGKWSFDYWLWGTPLSAPVAAAAASGAVPVPRRQRYRFSLRFRDDQKRLKAFGVARQMGEDA